MLGARLAAIRRAAVKSLKFVPEHHAPPVSALLDDESQMVKAEAARCVRRLRVPTLEPAEIGVGVNQAVEPNIGPGFSISNYDEVAEFWRNRG